MLSPDPAARHHLPATRLWRRIATAASLLCASYTFAGCSGCQRQHNATQAIDARADDTDSDAGADLTPTLSLVMPTGNPPRLRCDQAQLVANQLREILPFSASAPAPTDFAAALREAIDPYGLWTAADDYAGRASMETSAAALAAELAEGDCKASQTVGLELGDWVTKLRERVAAGRAAAASTGSAGGHAAEVGTPIWPELAKAAAKANTATGNHVRNAANLSSPAAALNPATASHAATTAHAPAVGNRTRKLMALARAFELGRSAAQMEGEYPTLAPYTQMFFARVAPELDTEAWREVVLAASMRSYAPLVDAHGAWVPRDEEATMYELDLDELAPGRLWHSAAPLLVGARIEAGALTPLRDGDIVLEIDGAKLAGFSPEQLHQASRASFTHSANIQVAVWRDGKIETLKVARNAQAVADPDLPGLHAEAISLTAGSLLYVQVPDIHESFGTDLAEVLRTHASAASRGLVLDLRGNGGGSMEGALAGLALFLPSLPMFPMRDRDGDVQPDLAIPRDGDPDFAGPVAVLVDAHTASAAEMIAGALGAYDRGTVIGTRTFGKGCIQEFFNDAAGDGILKATTMLYALPNGSAVQRSGLAPSVSVPFLVDDNEREASLPYAPPVFHGPDVRMQTHATYTFTAPLVPASKCADPTVCAAVAALNRSLTKSPRP